mmetsp:Transcript_13353/g.56897  ORF Transcript_13353/g.56897 Transcript_13353/m.56897 type:complete len:205 (-) Transcript_13353:342-956(-)
MDSAAPSLANSLASLAAGKLRLRRARFCIARSNPRAFRRRNVSRHSRRSAVKRARASATAASSAFLSDDSATTADAGAASAGTTLSQITDVTSWNASRIERGSMPCVSRNLSAAPHSAVPSTRLHVPPAPCASSCDATHRFNSVTAGCGCAPPRASSRGSKSETSAPLTNALLSWSTPSEPFVSYAWLSRVRRSRLASRRDGEA